MDFDRLQTSRRFWLLRLQDPARRRRLEQCTWLASIALFAAAWNVLQLPLIEFRGVRDGSAGLGTAHGDTVDLFAILFLASELLSSLLGLFAQWLVYWQWRDAAASRSRRVMLAGWIALSTVLTTEAVLTIGCELLGERAGCQLYRLQAEAALGGMWTWLSPALTFLCTVAQFGPAMTFAYVAFPPTPPGKDLARRPCAWTCAGALMLACALAAMRVLGPRPAFPSDLYQGLSLVLVLTAVLGTLVASAGAIGFGIALLRVGPWWEAAT